MKRRTERRKSVSKEVNVDLRNCIKALLNLKLRLKTLDSVKYKTPDLSSPPCLIGTKGLSAPTPWPLCPLV